VKKVWSEIELDILKSVKKFDHPAVFKMEEYGHITKKTRLGERVRV
jgi:hypothetical protein